jgi:two-component system chemotaxis sensor kinase CheA
MLREMLDEIPEALLRAAYAEAEEEGVRPLLASCAAHVSNQLGTRLQALPAFKWGSAGSERTAFLLLCDAEGLAAAVGDALAAFELEAIEPAALCRPRGDAGAALDPRFLVEAGQRLATRDGLGLWRAARHALGEVAPRSLTASTLRWLTAVLETGHPDRALLVRLLGGEQALGALPALPSADASERRARGALERDVLMAQLALLEAPYDGELLEGRLLAAATVLERLLAGLGEACALAAGPLADARAEALARRDVEPLRALVRAALAAGERGAAAGLDGPPSSPAAAVVAAPAAVSVASAAPSPAPLAPAAGARAGASAVASAEPGERAAPRVLKVDPERIDALMGLVGELVVAKNSLPFLAQKAERDYAARALAREIKERYAVINRIAEELQGAVMRTRMVPLESVFRRFPRLVRDLSDRLQKQVRLDVVGEETEADRGVVEQLFDPLVHLLRNSMDHGLETPAERTRGGKAPEGRLVLKAAQVDDRVVIEVVDDGRGIDPARVKRKALEKGLRTAEELERLSEDEIVQLIFAPGFSTAEQVSDLSGRGVGMDVVRTMVAAAGGTITLVSQLGQGTHVTITLPTTLAVSRVMVVELAGTVLGIPFAAIVETVRLRPGDVRRVAGGEAIVLRDRLVPIVDLAKVLGLGGGSQRTDGGKEPAVLVTRVGGLDVGLKVDELQGNVDVLVKPPVGVIRHLKLVSGTALLGDGRVLLVVDLDEIGGMA